MSKFSEVKRSDLFTEITYKVRKGDAKETSGWANAKIINQMRCL